MKKTLVLFFAVSIIVSCSWFRSNPPQEVPAAEAKQSETSNDSEHVCTSAYEKTVSAMNQNGDFKELHQFFKNNKDCMDAGYSEGIEGAISTTLDTFWTKTPDLKKLFDEDQDFKKFFFASMGCYVSATEKAMNNVLSKAQNNCPAGMSELCKELKNKAEEAIAYSKTQ